MKTYDLESEQDVMVEQTVVFDELKVYHFLLYSVDEMPDDVHEVILYAMKRSKIVSSI